jgi:hypothetical protein
MTTVAMNPNPSAIATSRRRFLSITTFPECSVAEDNISEVMSKMMAMTASHRLMSDIDMGKFMFHPL